MLFASSQPPAIQLANGRTAWLLSAGDAVTVASPAPITLEIRFHGGTSRCESSPGTLEVVQDGQTVARLRDVPPAGFQTWWVATGYRDFPALASRPVRYEIPSSSNGMTILRFSGGSCGASISSLE